MATNNKTNFPNLTTKAVPTTSDLLEISDQAAAGVPKQITLSNFPALNVQQVTQYSQSGLGVISISMPGMYSALQSDSITTGLNTFLNTAVIFIPFYASSAWTTSSLKIIVKTGLASSTATMGIYASLSANAGSFANTPTGAALAVGSVSTATSNAIASASVVASLSANTLYWAAIQLSSSATLAIALGKISFGPISWATSSGTTFFPTILTQTNTYSAGTLPTIASITYIANANTLYAPIIAGL